VKRDLVFVDRVRDTARHCQLTLWLVTGGFRIWALGELCCCVVTVVVLQSFASLCFSILDQKKVAENRENLTRIGNQTLPQTYLELSRCFRNTQMQLFVFLDFSWSHREK
jgi:hypothetical protein